MSNYPPGTSAGDPNAPWNAPDRSHEHEWFPTENDLVIEDGAAIFHLECNYAEGRYGEGWQCEETKMYRFEYSKLIANDKLYEGSIYSTDLYAIENWEQNSEAVRERIITIEEEFCSNGNGEIDVDPDPEHGAVTIEQGEWELRYEP